MLVVVDEHTRNCLSIDVARRIASEDMLERLSDLFVRGGVPLRPRATRRLWELLGKYGM